MSSEMSPSPSESASPPAPTNDSNESGLAARRLRPYQREVALAILESVFGKKGLTFSVETSAL